MKVTFFTKNIYIYISESNDFFKEFLWSICQYMVSNVAEYCKVLKLINLVLAVVKFVCITLCQIVYCTLYKKFNI